MGKLKRFYKILSLVSMVLGAVILISSQNTILGNVIGTSKISDLTALGFGSFFLIAGIALFIVQRKDKE